MTLISLLFDPLHRALVMITRREEGTGVERRVGFMADRYGTVRTEREQP
jgi:hypothetical protein